jgi:putative transposase
MSGELVSRVLDRVLGDRTGPRSITVDHGTEFPSRAWKTGRIAAACSSTSFDEGKLVENSFIESFNGRLRDECLNVHQFASLGEAQAIIEAWRVDDNTRRPHSSLGHLTPSEFVRQRQEEQDTEEVVCSG